MDFVITLIIHNSTDGSLESRVHVEVMWHKTSPELQIRSRQPCWRWFSCTIRTTKWTVGNEQWLKAANSLVWLDKVEKLWLHIPNHTTANTPLPTPPHPGYKPCSVPSRWETGLIHDGAPIVRNFHFLLMLHHSFALLLTSKVSKAHCCQEERTSSLSIWKINCECLRCSARYVFIAHLNMPGGQQFDRYNHT